MTQYKKPKIYVFGKLAQQKSLDQAFDFQFDIKRLVAR